MTHSSWSILTVAPQPLCNTPRTGSPNTRDNHHGNAWHHRCSVRMTRTTQLTMTPRMTQWTVIPCKQRNHREKPRKPATYERRSRSNTTPTELHEKRDVTSYGHISSERQHSSGMKATQHDIERNLHETRDICSYSHVLSEQSISAMMKPIRVVWDFTRTTSTTHNVFATWKQHPSATHETRDSCYPAWGIIYETSADCSNLTYHLEQWTVVIFCAHNPWAFISLTHLFLWELM